MMSLEPTLLLALAALALAIVALVVVRLRRRGGTRSTRRPARQENLDTVLSWQPEAVRVMTASESKAHALLKKALPGFVVLAQVPMSRFLRVPTRNSYSDWLQRVGHLNVDLLLCDSSSKVLAVIDVRAPQESERSRRRHERMVKVLKAAGITVHIWKEDDLPSVQDVRTLFGAILGGAAAGEGGAQLAQAARGAASGQAQPLIPVADISEVLAEGDREAERSDAMEPVPSGFFDDLDTPKSGAKLH